MDKRIIVGVKADREAGLKAAETCAKYYISHSTYYRILRGEYDDKFNNNVLDEPPDVAPDVNKLYPVGHGKQLKCGLVKERHDMPTDLYVFNEALSEELMFDYQAQLEICEAFIDTYVGYGVDAEPDKDVILYVTGIQCALAAFIKACSNKRVNLILRHYNAATNKYKYQSIWSEFGQAYNSCLAAIIGQARGVYTFNSKLEDIDISKFYTVTVVTYVIDDGKKIPTSELYICKNLSKAYQLNYIAIEQLIYTDKLYTVFLEERQLNSKGTGYFTDHILKSTR